MANIFFSTDTLTRWRYLHFIHLQGYYYYYYPPFIDDETEAQSEHYVICSRSHSYSLSEPRFEYKSVSLWSSAGNRISVNTEPLPSSHESRNHLLAPVCPALAAVPPSQPDHFLLTSQQNMTERVQILGRDWLELCLNFLGPSAILQRFFSPGDSHTDKDHMDWQSMPGPQDGYLRLL